MVQGFVSNSLRSMISASRVARLPLSSFDGASIFTSPSIPVLEEDVPRLRRIPESDRPVISIPLLGTHIHAPTAAILYQLREVALRGRTIRVAEFEQPVFAWR